MTETIHDTTGPEIGIPDGHDADPGPIIDAIQRPSQWEPETVTTEWGETRTKEEPTEWRWLPKMDLPGFGSETDTCGDDIPRFCECCGETVTVGRTCRRSTCPRCARAWNLQAAARLTSKLEAVWAYQYAALDSHPYYHHVVISPPDDWVLSDDPETVYWRTLDVVKEILDELGLAGIPIYHPYRGDHEDPEANDMGEWKHRVHSGRDWGDVSEELEFSPHFHILGVSPHVDVSVTERVEEMTGWVIHRITQSDSNVSIGNTYDLARAAAYCLSHCGIYEDSNGDMSAAYHPRISERVPEGTPVPEDDTEQEVDRIVRSVAPRVLDVEYSAVACEAAVPEAVAADAGVSLAAGSVSGSGDSGDSSSSDAGEQDDQDGSAKRKCRGRMLHISRAPNYINDDEWRERALAAEHLENRYYDWKREEGIA